MSDASVTFFKGRFCSFHEAQVSVRSKAINYGLGCFEGIRAYWNPEAKQLYVFRPREHYERLRQSCRILHLNLPYTVEQLIDLTAEVCRRNHHREDVYVRPLVFNNHETLSPTLTSDPAEFALYTLPLREYLDTSKGVTACVSSWRRLTDNMIPARAKPTAAYLNSALARHEAKANGYDEAIFLTHDGYVSEGSAEHIFLVRHGGLLTPTSQEDNLDGITRRTICELAGDLDLPVTERRVSRTELYVAEEAFLCGTGAEVTPLVEIDRRPLGNGKPGPVTERVKDYYYKVVHGSVPKYAAWTHAVYA